MKRPNSRDVIIVGAVAVVAAVAGAAGMYTFLSFQHPSSPGTFSGSFSGVSSGRVPTPCSTGACSLFFLNASLILETLSSLDPQQVLVTVSALNGSLNLPNGFNVSSWTMHYIPNAYPHWLIQSGDVYSNYLTAVFVDPGGGVVGTLNASQTPATSISSGASMTIMVYQVSPSGVAVTLSYAGYAGTLELTVG
jgi:hypothetical protein